MYINYICTTDTQCECKSGRNIKNTYSTQWSRDHVYECVEYSMHVNQTESVLLLYIVPFGENKWVAKFSVPVQLDTCYSTELTLLLQQQWEQKQHPKTQTHPINGMSSYVFGSLRLTEIALTLVAVGFFSTSGCSSEMLVIERISFSGCDVQEQMVECEQTSIHPHSPHVRKIKITNNHTLITEFMAENAFTSHKQITAPVKIQFIYLILLLN